MFTPLFIVLVKTVFSDPFSLHCYLKVTFERIQMFFLTSKWVYESTEIIPHEKKDCKLFLHFSENMAIFDCFRPYILIFQALYGFSESLLVVFSVFCLRNHFVAIRARNRDEHKSAFSVKT